MHIWTAFGLLKGKLREMSDFQKKDEILVKRLISGDSKAFEQIYYKYQKRLYHFALKLTKEPSVAEEVLQEVFIKLWTNRKQINPVNLKAYIYKMVGNKAFNYLRTKAFREETEKKIGESLIKSNTQTESAVLFSEYEQLLQDFIRQLPPQKREIYLLSEQKGKSSQEIARQLNLSTKTVQNNLSQIVKLMKSRLKPYLTSTISLLLILFRC